MGADRIGGNHALRAESARHEPTHVRGELGDQSLDSDTHGKCCCRARQEHALKKCDLKYDGSRTKPASARCATSPAFQMRLFSFLVCLFCMLVRARPSLKPAVILVPGAFHGPRAFDKVVGRLASAGYHFVDAVALPSAGQLVGRQADVDAVKDVLCEHGNRGCLQEPVLIRCRQTP